MKMTAQEWQMLLERLRNNDPLLTTLNLDNNSIGADGAKALAPAIEHNNTLTQLDLEGNLIGADGAKALAPAIKHNNTLTWLGLSENSIGADGAKALAPAIEHNNTLTWLGLSENSIGDATIKEELDAIIQRNRQLRDEMHQAVQQGNIAKVNHYLQQGVSLVARSDNDFNTPLHIAILANQVAMASHLIQRMRQQGLTLNMINKDDKTAAQLAQGTSLSALFTSAAPSFAETASTTLTNVNSPTALTHNKSKGGKVCYPLSV